MIKLTIQFLIIFLLTNCSINSKSKFWKESERKKIETSSEIELFKEKKSFSEEYNTNIKISLNNNYQQNSFLNNTSSAISSSTTTSFTASTYPTFISGRTVSTGGGDFTVTVGGSAHTLSMRDGDGGTYDVFATLLPAGATISGNQFTYVAVQLRPG